MAEYIEFDKDHKVLDVGTGGGFPGIPLAIMFPDTHFHLIDSIGKKITVVEEIAMMLDLENVQAQQIRAEKVRGKYHFVVSRAVTQMPKFVSWVRQKIEKNPLKNQKLANGILYLKGGDLSEELIEFPHAIEYPISKFFENDPEFIKFKDQCSKTGTTEESIAQAEKLGFKTNLVAQNPFNESDKVPVYFANFVLMDYGFGAVFGCPAHDERDFEFAQKYQLPIKKVVECDDDQLPYTGDGKILNSPLLNGLNKDQAINKIIEHLEINKIKELIEKTLAL